LIARGWRHLRWLAGLAAVSGCAGLPAVATGACGNGVIEPPEDCDSFAPDAHSLCLSKGSPGECHFSCRAAADGFQPTCPAGWGCDSAGICREPTGSYTALPEVNVGRAFSLLAGDFDGDGRTDVVTAEPLDVRGGTRLSFHYFDANGALAESRDFPKLLASPSVVELSGDGRADLAFTTFSVGLLLGHADRSLVPETFSSYHFPGASVRFLVVNGSPIGDLSAVVSATAISGVWGLYLPDNTGILQFRGSLPAPMDDLLATAVGGDLIEDPLASPCWEVVLAARGATSFSVVDSCVRSAPNAPITWRDQFIETTVALDPPAPIDAAPQILDVNGDGHLDVLIGAAGGAYVAYGDGHGVRTAERYLLTLSNPDEVSPDIAMPLAAGDFSGDGLIDFVFPNYLLLSVPDAPGGPPRYVPDDFNDGLPWTVARIADLNGDGNPDVVAASALRLGMEFFNGTGNEHLHAFNIPTNRAVSDLAVGDLDGDLINDLAFVERMAADDRRDVVMAAFGAPAGPPAAAIPVARIRQIEDLNCLPEFGLGNLLVASTVAENGTTDGVLAILTGSGDRLPFAPYQLVNVSADGTVGLAAALGVATGNFLGSGKTDVLALTSRGAPNQHDFAFWILPAFGGAQNQAFPVGGALDTRLQPAVIDGFFVKVNTAATSGDLDRDGRDEAVWALPADGGAGCGVVAVGVSATADGPTADVHAPIFIDQPCPGAQIATVDADRDGALDLALLTGAAGTPGRKLLLLWNDGHGHFAAQATTTVNDPLESPEQFTVLPPAASRPPAIAYVTANAVVVREPTADPRKLGPPQKLLSLESGSGIVAGDMNGDGVSDLAVASSGTLRVLRAELHVP
jgi:FG-GAP-like repeat/FG-GAP repeat